MEYSSVKKLPKLLQECTLPTITNAFVTNDQSNMKNGGEKTSCHISVLWKQNCYETSEKMQYESMYVFNDGETPEIHQVPSFPVTRSSFLLESISPSLSQKAVIKKHANAVSKKDDYILEIWSSSPMTMKKSINLTSFDQHGQVHADAVFGSLNWSDDESKLVYVAEKKKAKNIGFYDRIASNDDESEEPARGEKYNYEENWGELLTEVVNPVICLINIMDETLLVISDISQDICPAQPQWGPGNSLVFEGIEKKPYRLGRIYCENRKSVIYQLQLDDEKKIAQLSESKINAARYFPRVSHCKSKVVFLQNILKDTGNPHRNAEGVMVYEFGTKTLRKLDPQDLSGKTVPLFSHSLPNDCWLNDNIHIVIPLTIEGRAFAGVLNTDSGRMIGTISCTELFGVHSNLILTSYMKLDSAVASLQVSKYTDSMLNNFAEPYQIDNTLKYGCITDTNGIVSHYLVPNIYSGSLPLIVIPHGGPHSVYTNNFSRNARVFCKLGYAVLLVNYRGSTGFTADLLNALPGHVGTVDVNDVQNFVLQFIEIRCGEVDLKNIFVIGGSHGGFLGAHLVGQYPEFYRAAVLLNPVIDIASMFLVTDIPDWDYFEAGIPYTQETIPTSDSYKAMIEKSPIIYVKAVKAPILLCIGGKDARVPPSQGKGYFRLLKANGKIAKLLFYPDDSHPLSSVETDGDVVINMCEWLITHRFSE